MASSDFLPHGQLANWFPCKRAAHPVQSTRRSAPTRRGCLSARHLPSRKDPRICTKVSVAKHSANYKAPGRGAFFALEFPGEVPRREVAGYGILLPERRECRSPFHLGLGAEAGEAGDADAAQRGSIEEPRPEAGDEVYRDAEERDLRQIKSAVAVVVVVVAFDLTKYIGTPKSVTSDR